MSAARDQAVAEALFCAAILAKTGDSVLTATLQGADRVEHWQHFPKGDVFDPESGATWFYHCHPRAEGSTEHGHFHCFLRPAGAGGPIHHLVAIGVDAHGRLLRLFTVNHWVVGDDWLDAAGTVPLLERFDAHLARPCYLVNRWLTAVIRAHEPQIAALIAERDRTLAAHHPDPATARADRALEVTSEYRPDPALWA